MIVAKRIAALLVMLGLGAAALVTMSWNLRLPLTDPALAGTMLDDPARVFRQLPTAMTGDAFAVSKAYRNQVRAAAQRDPLSDEAFVLAAIAAREQGRYREALGRLEQARRRDPRNRITRIMLFEAYLGSARAAEVVIEAAALDRLRAGTNQALFPLLASLAQNPSTREGAAQALRSTTLEYPIMRALAEQQVSPELLLSFAEDPDARDMRDERVRQQITGMITPYLRAENWAAAAQLWGHFYGIQPATLNRVTDPDFSGDPGAPFGWQFMPFGGGLAELEEQGLQVVHFGRKGGVVAQQALLLDPGTYRLGYELRDNSDTTPDLVWRVQCMGSAKAGGIIMLELPFQRMNLLGVAARDSFTLQAGTCEAQWLTLAARAGTTAQTREVTIRSVTISRLGPA